MTGPTAPAPAPDPDQRAALGRRGLLRGGALIAGAAVGGVAATALGGGVASAADGDPVLAGESNATEATTALTIGGSDGSAKPTLDLSNANGPTLHLQPLAADYSAEMELGQIANTVLGPVIGVDSLLGETTTFLATGIDLDDLPTPYALPKPVRVLDTRTTAGRSRIIRTSSGALNSDGRLKPRSWIDVEVSVEDADFEVPSAYLNVVATGGDANGFLAVYPPGDYPGTSTLNFQARITLANGCFVATGIVEGRYAVRVYGNALTHVVLDLTGVTVRGGSPTAAAAQKTSSAKAARAAKRLRSTLTERVRRNVSR